MEMFLIKDPRIGYLVDPSFPALWSLSPNDAKMFSEAEIAGMKEAWPYLNGCKVIGPYNPAPEVSPEFFEED